MADKDKVNNNIIKYNIEEKKKETKIPRKLKIQNSQISEEEITGDAAIRLFDLLFNSKPDPKKKEFIKKALQLFPEPEKSKELEIAL